MVPAQLVRACVRACACCAALIVRSQAGWGGVLGWRLVVYVLNVRRSSFVVQVSGYAVYNIKVCGWMSSSSSNVQSQLFFRPENKDGSCIGCCGMVSAKSKNFHSCPSFLLLSAPLYIYPPSHPSPAPSTEDSFHDTCSFPFCSSFNLDGA